MYHFSETDSCSKNEAEFISSSPGFSNAKLSTRGLIITDQKPKTNLKVSAAAIQSRGKVVQGCSANIQSLRELKEILFPRTA